MVRITMILLCFILAGASAGRYQAEVAVKQKREEIKNLSQVEAKELADIQLLRAEIAFLESPDRLATIAEKVTSLKPLSGSQLMTADDFAIAFGDEEPVTKAAPPATDTILHAIAMADSSLLAQ